jgi:hypothetical protein
VELERKTKKRKEAKGEQMLLLVQKDDVWIASIQGSS